MIIRFTTKTDIQISTNKLDKKKISKHSFALKLVNFFGTLLLLIRKKKYFDRESTSAFEIQNEL